MLQKQILCSENYLVTKYMFQLHLTLLMQFFFWCGECEISI